MSKLLNILFSEITEDKDTKENEIHAMLDQIKADNEVKIAEMTAEAVREAAASVTFTPDTKQASNEEEAKREVDVTPDTAQ